MLSPDTEAAISGALTLAKRDGCHLWGFVHWSRELPTGEDELGFQAFDNYRFSERDLIKMTQMALKYIRKNRSKRQVELEDEDPSVGGIN